MRYSARSLDIIVLALANLFCPAAWGQGTQPTPPAVQPGASAVQPAAPSGQATSQNPSIMLLKQGHSESVRAKAAQDLGKQGDMSTIPALADALSDPSPKVRREVVLALAQFHVPAALPPLEKATKDLDDDVRITAVQCLTGHYTGILPGSGISGFMRRNWQRAAGHFQSDDTRIDPGVLVDPTVVSTLIAVMKDTHSNEASRQAAKALGILLAKPAVPDLVEAAHSSDSDLAREALNALSKIKDIDAGPKLVDLLDSPNKDIKRDACNTLGILRTKQALSKLQAIYQNDPDEKDKAAAMQGLAYLGDKASVPLFTEALTSPDKSIRQGAGEGLARAADPQCLAKLEEALNMEKDGNAKLAMNFALAALDKEDGLNYVVNELSSKIRGDIARTYLIELSRNPAFLSKLYPYLQSKDSGVRAGLCGVLMYSGDQSSLQQLDRLEHDPDGEVAAAAMRAKSAIRSRLGASAPATKS